MYSSPYHPTAFSFTGPSAIIVYILIVLLVWFVLRPYAKCRYDLDLHIAGADYHPLSAGVIAVGGAYPGMIKLLYWWERSPLASYTYSWIQDGKVLECYIPSGSRVHTRLKNAQL